MTPEETILKAIEILERDGWHQGDIQAGKPDDEFDAKHAPVCAMGALYRAAYGTCDGPTVRSLVSTTPAARRAFEGAYDRLADVVTRIHGVAVPTFNDRPDTTKEDVILAMKKAAELAAEKETTG